MVARVVVDAKTTFVDKIFDYEIPPHLQETAAVGVRVQVPFGSGNRHYVGFVVSLDEKSESDKALKPIISIIDTEPLLDRTRLVEAYRIKSRYFCTFADAIRLFLPVGAKTEISERVGIFSDINIPDDLGKTERDIVQYLREHGESEYSKIAQALEKSVRADIKGLVQRGILYSDYDDRKMSADKFITVVSLSDSDFDIESLKKTAAAQRRVVKVLAQCEFLSIPDLCMFAGCSSQTINTLVEKNIVEKHKIEVLRTPHSKIRSADEESVTLTDEQKDVLSVIEQQKQNPKKPVLLRGVTGSGKTEVYLRAIESVLKDGKSAIVLVPEISLTYQMMSRFVSRFGHSVALLHSSLSDGERFDEWKRIRNGNARVVVGARSAVFAPCKNLGIIVVDEEHEDTYKAEDKVGYDAREVARIRTANENALLLLSSATPAIEDYYRAKSGMFTLCEMNNRYNGVSLPKTYIADMREELRQGNRTPFSDVLSDEMKENIASGEQTILLLNRRGYSTFVSCRSCGHVEMCPNCNISLTYHSNGDYLMCHYCGHKKPMPQRCSECESTGIRGFGTGTQKIEEKLGEVFSDASVIRMDVDTTRKKDSHEKILESFENDKIDVLLGTQMVSKGLDFKNVSLVGVLAADQILNMGDYRAAEKTFDLITQVCGRSGRGDKRGRAVIQTYMPENSTITYASRHDYTGFYEEEIALRRAMYYPPFCSILNITITGENEKEVKEATNAMSAQLSEKLSGAAGVRLYRAAPCYIDKIKNKYRWHFWFKCVLNKEIHEILNEVIQKEKKLIVSVDLNPTSI